MIETLQSIVLRSEDLGEFDQRLTLFTLEHGKIRAKVAGVKKEVSKLRSFALPFSESRLQVYLHGAKRSGVRDPGKVIGGETITFHAPLRADWDRMIQASAVCEILEALTKPFNPNLKEYELISSTLQQMETTVHPLLLRLKFSLMLLKLLGYSLRHHPIWNTYSDAEQGLLREFALWNHEQEKFSDDQRGWLERVTTAYLSQYLHGPLKTDVFRQKLASGAYA